MEERVEERKSECLIMCSKWWYMYKSGPQWYRNANIRLSADPGIYLSTSTQIRVFFTTTFSNIADTWQDIVVKNLE